MRRRQHPSSLRLRCARRPRERPSCAFLLVRRIPSTPPPPRRHGLPDEPAVPRGGPRAVGARAGRGLPRERLAEPRRRHQRQRALWLVRRPAAPAGLHHVCRHGHRRLRRPLHGPAVLLRPPHGLPSERTGGRVSAGAGAGKIGFVRGFQLVGPWCSAGLGCMCKANFWALLMFGPCTFTLSMRFFIDCLRCGRYWTNSISNSPRMVWKSGVALAIAGLRFLAARNAA